MSFRTKKKQLEKIRERFGRLPSDYEKERTRERLDRIAIYHRELEEKEGPASVDGITWNDLQMDEVFLRINHTGSYMGEQALYHRLHGGERGETSWEALERQITFFRENPDERTEIEEALSRIGKRKEDYYMPQFLMNARCWQMQNGFLLHLLQLLLLAFGIGAIVTENIICAAGLLAVALVNLVIYTMTRQKYEAFLYSLGSLKQMLLFCQRITAPSWVSLLAVPEDVVKTAGELKGISKKIVGLQTRKYAALTGDMLYLLQDYLFGITLLDLSAFNHIMRLINAKEDQIMKLYAFAGQIDMSISIASFRESLPFYCLPEKGTGAGIFAEKLIHPLLKQPVANDFVLEGRALITGANASGKSTFMKALAINTILARSIHTCTAKSFALPQVQVMTSMSLRDDVLNGESYYVREAARIREMLESGEDASPKLLVIDEILKGTNTAERLAASFAILDYLAGTKNFAVIATHDMELLYDLGAKYENYYFESTVTDTDIVFEYRIHKGRGGNSNAIGLLALLGYPEKIIAAARKRLGQAYANQ